MNHQLERVFFFFSHHIAEMEYMGSHRTQLLECEIQKKEETS